MYKVEFEGGEYFVTGSDGRSVSCSVFESDAQKICDALNLTDQMAEVIKKHTKAD